MNTIHDIETSNFFKVVSDDDNVIKGIFKNNTIRFSQPWVLNDPLECRPEIEFDEEFEVDTKYIVDGVPFASFRELVEHDLIGSNFNQYGILSLSKHIPGIKMWNMYSNNHKGVTIVFKNGFHDRLFYQGVRCSSYKYFLFDKVNYCKKNSVKHDDLLVDNDYDQFKVNRNLYLQKTLEWDYENEWRAICPVKQPETSGIRFYDDKSLHLMKFDKEDIEAIIFGANCSKDLYQKIESYTKGYNCEYWRGYITINDDGPKINYNPIPDLGQHISTVRESNVYSQKVFDNFKVEHVKDLKEIPYINTYPRLKETRFRSSFEKITQTNGK